MSVQSHIVALQQRHLELEEKLQAELTHLSADEQVISELKRKKLEIKDELAKLKTKAA